MNMNTGKDTVYRDFIQNAIYQKSHILEIFGTTPNQYKRYLELDCIKASIRRSRESGKANLYSFDDLMKIYHFLLLLNVDIKVKMAAKIINHKNSNDYPFSLTKVYSDKPPACLIQGNIKLDTTAVTESLCETIFRTIKLDELQQRK